MRVLSRGALLGARGNSGVILSQMLGAYVARLAEGTHDVRNAVVAAEAMQRATDASYAAVGEPVEGTILTVARAASDAAMARASVAGARARDVFTAAAGAAREALARTTDPAQGAGRRRCRGRRRPRPLRRPGRRRDRSTGRRPPPPPVGVHRIPVPLHVLAGDGSTSRPTARPTR